MLVYLNITAKYSNRTVTFHASQQHIAFIKCNSWFDNKKDMMRKNLSKNKLMIRFIKNGVEKMKHPSIN